MAKKKASKGRRFTAEQVQRGLKSIQTVTSLEAFEYVITSVPSGCTMYSIDDIIELWFQPPPPSTVVLNYGSPCNGITADLIG